MPSARSKSPMSLGELATCEDLLDGHREYAIDLLSNIEKIRQWHGTDSCPETRKGRSCTLCGLCSADGLMGTTKSALASYEEIEDHLKDIRTLFGKNAPGHGVVNGDVVFKSNSAKAVFLCIATAGDSLRSQHATWQARLQNEVTSLSPSTQNVQPTNTRPDDSDKNRNGSTLLSTYSGTWFVSPEHDAKLTAISTGSVSETSSSVFVIFRRCLSADCSCNANKPNGGSKADLRSACGSQATSKALPLPVDSKKTRASKVTRSTTTNHRRHSNKTSDASDALTQMRTDALTQKPKRRGPDAHALDAQIVQGTMLGQHKISSSASDAASLIQKIGSSSECEALIIDPRISRLRAQILLSDDVYRALMEWCRAWLAEMRTTGSIHDLAAKDMHGYPPALTPGFKAVESRKSLRMTGQVEDITNGDDEIQFDCEQEELKGRWLTARQKRFKERRIRPDLV